jgi:hypothetical protein
MLPGKPANAFPDSLAVHHEYCTVERRTFRAINRLSELTPHLYNPMVELSIHLFIYPLSTIAIMWLTFEPLAKSPNRQVEKGIFSSGPAF